MNNDNFVDDSNVSQITYTCIYMQYTVLRDGSTPMIWAYGRLPSNSEEKPNTHVDRKKGMINFFPEGLGAVSMAPTPDGKGVLASMLEYGIKIGHFKQCG